MRRSLDSIDPGLLRRLYVDQDLTAEHIPTQLGCTSRTILRRLRAAGIRTRPRGPAPRRAMPPRWGVQTAYVVGLMADGNLSSDGRHLSFVSRDRELVETLRAANLGSPLREGGLHQADPMDALRRECPLPSTQARQGGEVSCAAWRVGGACGRAAEGRMAVQCRRAGFGTAGASGPGWRNGRLAALKTPCPQGRAGSNPAPGTNLTTPFLTRPAAGR
jgi:hypothetical protein